MGVTFSVIIPTYNRARIIQGTLRSVLDQTFRNYEIIVVDDGSNDGTRQRVEAMGDGRIKYFFKTNEERSVARNFGAEHASGRYLIFLDSDDRMRSDHLMNLHDYLERHRFRPRFLFAGFVVFNPDGTRLYQFRHDGIFERSRLLYGNYLGCSSVVVEAELFSRFRFNTHPNIILFEDWELWLRIISEEPLHCIPQSSIIMINHAGRSVLHYSAAQLKMKIAYFMNDAFSRITLVNQKQRTRRIFAMGLYSYLALHVAMGKADRRVAVKYLVKALRTYPGFMAKRRFLGILKSLVF